MTQENHPQGPGYGSAKQSFTTREAAEELGISTPLVWNLIRSGDLLAYRFSPRKTVIYREDLEEFRRSRKFEVV